jgi:hypothetical protein
MITCPGEYLQCKVNEDTIDANYNVEIYFNLRPKSGNKASPPEYRP